MSCQNTISFVSIKNSLRERFLQKITEFILKNQEKDGLKLSQEQIMTFVYIAFQDEDWNDMLVQILNEAIGISLEDKEPDLEKLMNKQITYNKDMILDAFCDEFSS